MIKASYPLQPYSTEQEIYSSYYTWFLELLISNNKNGLKNNFHRIIREIPSWYTKIFCQKLIPYESYVDAIWFCVQSLYKKSRGGTLNSRIQMEFIRTWSTGAFFNFDLIKLTYQFWQHLCIFPHFFVKCILYRWKVWPHFQWLFLTHYLGYIIITNWSCCVKEVS